MLLKLSLLIMKERYRKTPVKEDCAIEVTLNVISGKWKPAILSGLFKGPPRPKDLCDGLPEATKRVITQQLRELERDGIVVRKVYDEVPLRVEYSFTKYGKSLLPVIKALSKWGEEYKRNNSPYKA
jgi:DNA-binding HxlR family transcriptional regulator